MSSKGSEIRVADKIAYARVCEEAVAHINSEPFSDAVRALALRVDKGGVKKCWLACEIQRLVLDNVEYDFSLGPNFNRDPVETWNKGGKCVDQSVLLASMLKAAGFRCRLVTVHHGKEGHMFVEVYLDAEIEPLKESINEYVDQLEIVTVLQQYGYTESERSGYWLMTDPTCSLFVGDAAGLHQDGYTSGVFTSREV